MLSQKKSKKSFRKNCNGESNCPPALWTGRSSQDMQKFTMFLFQMAMEICIYQNQFSILSFASFYIFILEIYLLFIVLFNVTSDIAGSIKFSCNSKCSGEFYLCSEIIRKFKDTIICITNRNSCRANCRIKWRK